MNIETIKSIIIESAPRTPIRVSREQGRTVLRQGSSWLSMTDDELDAVLDAVERLTDG